MTTKTWAAPDCRTCRRVSREGRDCESIVVCINGDCYSPTTPSWLYVKESLPPGHKAIAQRLQQLAGEMLSVAADMDYYGGLAEWAQHGKELVGAALMTREWSVEILDDVN
jgi:hypothetical protein